MTFEDAMIAVTRATDENCNPVNLYHGPWTADSLREATESFALHISVAHDYALVFNGPMGEAAAWENLAKLATATAAAIREGR